MTASQGANPKDLNFWRYSHEPAANLKRMAEVALALSSESDIARLLELIVQEARHLARADAGSLYMVDASRTVLEFAVLQNHSLGVHMGGATGIEPDLPSVPLYLENGDPNHANVSAHVVHTGKVLSIDDVYSADEFDFSGTKEYDILTGYRCRSMLVIPMQNHEGDIIGVLQLINAFEPNAGTVTAFSDTQEELAAALASLAAVALTKTQLIRDLSELFHSFTQSIAAAIDAKSPYTAGHIRRVAHLTRMLARQINEEHSGPLARTFFSQEEMEELGLAAWLHDVGKIVTPEHILDKSCKLSRVMDCMQLVDLRFDLIRACIEAQYLQGTGGSKAQEELRIKLAELEEDRLFLHQCNNPSQEMDRERLEKLQEIGGKTFLLHGQHRPYLEPEEVERLAIVRGTLTAQERMVIEDHARATLRILRQLKFPKKYSRIPLIAGQHHEKLDGSGYPARLHGDEICLQARILGIADIFEALTAPDRPYKNPMNLEQALDVLQAMRREGKIDPDIHDVFVRRRIFDRYAQEYLQGRLRDEYSRQDQRSSLHTLRLEQLVPVQDPCKVWDEVSFLALDMNPDVDRAGVYRVYEDVQRLFKGRYPGYRPSTTKYHDYEHTCSVLLTAARLLHGYKLSENTVSADHIHTLCLAALFHDTGFIQKQDDDQGTGAKYLIGHEQRSIEFMREYFAHAPKGFAHLLSRCESMIQCTILNGSLQDIAFDDEMTRTLGCMLGTADILAQMADVRYLKKLFLLYQEFEEARLPGYDSDIDLLRGTESFYLEVEQKRLHNELGNMSRFLPIHFQRRWGVDRDLYAQAIEENLATLRNVLKKSEDEIRKRLEEY